MSRAERRERKSAARDLMTTILFLVLISITIGCVMGYVLKSMSDTQPVVEKVIKSLQGA